MPEKIEATGDRLLLLQFLGSLTLCDHMGDVSNDVLTVLDRLHLPIGDWDEMCELGNELGKLGVTTLHGTSLLEEDYD